MLFDNRFDLIVSIGEDCACSSYLRRFNLQDFSFPFDWLTRGSFEARIDLLVNNFDNFLNKENIVLMQKPDDTDIDNKHDYYQDNVLNFYFYHDFKSGCDFDVEFVEVKNKYLRRIERLYAQIEKSKKVLFVWWSRNKHQDSSLVVRSYNKLNEKFKNNEIFLLLIEPSESHTRTALCNNHVLIKSYDNISYEHNQHWNKTMGNEANNTKVFSQIKKTRALTWYFKMFAYKFVRIFIELIPDKSLRRSLVDSWSYKFFKSKL